MKQITGFGSNTEPIAEASTIIPDKHASGNKLSFINQIDWCMAYLFVCIGLCCALLGYCIGVYSIMKTMTRKINDAGYVFIEKTVHVNGSTSNVVEIVTKD